MSDSAWVWRPPACRDVSHRLIADVIAFSITVIVTVISIVKIIVTIIVINIVINTNLSVAPIVVVVTQPGFGGPQPGSTCRYHSSPALIVCQHCNATVTTSTSYSVGTYTWLIAAIILFLGSVQGVAIMTM